MDVADFRDGRVLEATWCENGPLLAHWSDEEEVKREETPDAVAHAPEHQHALKHQEMDVVSTLQISEKVSAQGDR